MKTFKLIYQTDSKDCAPACLKMVAQHYGKHVSRQYFREACHISRQGTTMLSLAEAAEKIGFDTICAKIMIEQLDCEIALPCILLWKRTHYVVCYDVKGGGEKRKFYIADPGMGKRVVDAGELYRYWILGKHEGKDVGIAMQLEPSVNFTLKSDTPRSEREGTLSYFLPYILPHKWKIAQLLLGSLLIMGMGYLLPLISQMVVDIGVHYHDFEFIIVMMIMQLAISLLTTSIQFVQSWLSLNMHTVINIQLIANYLSKLSKMPLYFFEQRTLGDILQRIGDHDRIKAFLMNDLIGILFSITTFLTFSVVLFVYKWQIFTVFIAGSTFHVLWILAFMKYRREIDNKVFEQSSQLQNNLVQFVQGMQEIKLNNIERQKRWEWERIQARLYKISVRALRIAQVQGAGSFFFSTITNIAISYMTAHMVITGELTLGMMVSLAFIIGQVAAPIGSFIGFAQNYQDAKISLERLSDLYTHKDEEQSMQEILEIQPKGDIVLQNVSFSYSGAERDRVLHNISLSIPQGKVTALVGASGCGKTTLVKLMQGFYTPQEGQIYVGNIFLDAIRKSEWRANIGAVMQDGYIFSDTIARNIAVGEEEACVERMTRAVAVANLNDLLDKLPVGFNTKIGDEGVGLSQGQKQRILIARSIYKNPPYLFLDEATNALDSKNEREILQQVKHFYTGRTMVVVAHRLSTIRDADNIVVMSNGEEVGQGTHKELLTNCTEYINLINNQLDGRENE